MAKLPSSQDIQRQSPTVRRSVSSIDLSSAGRGLQQAGDAMFQYGEKSAKDDKALQRAYKKNEYVKQQSDWFNTAQENPDYHKLEESYTKWNSDAITKLSEGDEGLYVDLEMSGIRGLANARELARKKRNDYTVAYQENERSDFLNTLPTLSPAQREDRKNALFGAYDNSTDIYGYETREQLKRTLDSEVSLVNLTEAAKNNPREFLNEATGKTSLTAPPSGFDNIFDQVWLPLEGGYNPTDPRTGLPVNMGVDQKANPDIDTKNLTQDGARQIMKDRYWDFYGMDSVPADKQAVVFQALGNRPVLGKRMIKAAQDGASNAELLRMQAEELATLGGPVQAGWRKRIEDTAVIAGVTSAYGDDLANINPAQRAALVKQTLPSMVQFASPQERADLFSDYPEHADTLVAASKAVDSKLSADPAAYVMQSPQVQKSLQEFNANPTEQTQSNFLNNVRDQQINMGVPDYKVRYVTKDLATDFNTVLKSDGATAKQVLEFVDTARSQYGPVWQRATSDLRDMGVTGSVAVMAAMDSGAYRSELAEAVLMGKRVDALIPNDIKAADIEIAIEEELQDYQEAIMVTPEGGRALADNRDAISMLTKRYLSQGVSLDDAIENAMEAVIPHEVDGTLILPRGTDTTLVTFMADNMKADLTAHNIVAPFEIRNDPVRGELYRKDAIENSVPFVNGDNIIFLDQKGNPLIDADIAEFNDRGEILNAEEATISFPVSEATKFSDELQPQSEPDSVLGLRSRIMQTEGIDIKKYYTPTATATGKVGANNYYQKDAESYYNHVARVGSTSITKESYRSMTDTDKALAREQLAKNISYNERVMSNIPKETQKMLKQLITKSAIEEEKLSALQAAHKIASQESRSAGGVGFGGFGGAVVTEKTQQLTEALSRQKRFVGNKFGVGLQYLSMPEWAK